MAASQTSPKSTTEDPPETILATFYLKPDKVNDFFKMMPEYRQTLRTLNLIDTEPNLLLRGEDAAGKPIVTEIFTWKHSSTPDNAPPAIQAYWQRMNDMVEKRDGHEGIEFTEVHIFSSAK
jgi:hypothetical protein